MGRIHRLLRAILYLCRQTTRWKAYLRTCWELERNCAKSGEDKALKSPKQLIRRVFVLEDDDGLKSLKDKYLGPLPISDSYSRCCPHLRERVGQCSIELWKDVTCFRTSISFPFPSTWLNALYNSHAVVFFSPSPWNCPLQMPNNKLKFQECRPFKRKENTALLAVGLVSSLVVIRICDLGHHEISGGGDPSELKTGVNRGYSSRLRSFFDYVSLGYKIVIWNSIIKSGWWTRVCDFKCLSAT